MPNFEVKVTDRTADWSDSATKSPLAMNSAPDDSVGQPLAMDSSPDILGIPAEAVQAFDCVTVTIEATGESAALEAFNSMVEIEALGSSTSVEAR